MPRDGAPRSVRRGNRIEQNRDGLSCVCRSVAVLLDAIAASDGTRRSVTRHLLTARVRGGILGSFTFDRNGDTTFNPTMIFRIRGGKARLDRVITPRTDLTS